MDFFRIVAAATSARQELAQRGFMVLSGGKDDCSTPVRSEIVFLVDKFSGDRPVLASGIGWLFTCIYSLDTIEFGPAQVIAWAQFVDAWLACHDCYDASNAGVQFLRSVAWVSEKDRYLPHWLFMEHADLSEMCREDTDELVAALRATGLNVNGADRHPALYAFRLVWMIVHPRAVRKLNVRAFVCAMKMREESST